MKILLLSNYRNDRQWSMLKFGKFLADSLSKNKNFTTEEIFPLPCLGILSANKKVSKIGAYLDKYVLLPKRLTRMLKNSDDPFNLVHITDHSNAPYLKTIRRVSAAKCLVTCHDLIAIRTALGEFSLAPQTSLLGKRLQSWIQHSLPLANYFACDSKQTKSDLNRIVSGSGLRSKVIHLGTEMISENQCDLKSQLTFNPLNARYILHVGSAAWYKNRHSLFQAFQHVKQKKQYNDLKLVLVGPAPQAHEIDPNLKKWIERNPEDIFSITHASDQTLNQLYLNAEFLIFPSFIEGFGWPPLEAASSGCPVITTKTGAIHDLLGPNARYVDPSDQDSINLAVIQLLEQRDRTNEKISLPTDQQCRGEYYKLYHKLLQN